MGPVDPFHLLVLDGEGLFFLFDVSRVRVVGPRPASGFDRVVDQFEQLPLLLLGADRVA
jgi:hypothetical protein